MRWRPDRRALRSRGKRCRARRSSSTTSTAVTSPRCRRPLIDVNEAHVADLQPGQTCVGGVPPGPTSVTATGTAEPGHYVVKFNAVGGKTYAFQVAPRTDATRKVAMVLDTLPAVIEATAKGETGGPFKITQVAP
jgi:hypothetical protein